MPISANLIDAIQTKYQNSIRALAKEAKGSKLRGLAEKAIGKGKLDVVFYRSEEGTVFTGELDMYSPTWASTAGKIIKKTAEIDYIYWSHKIKQKELNSTDLSPQSQLLKSGMNTLRTYEDIQIMNVIKGTPGISVEGTSGSGIIAQLDDIVGTTKLAILSAKDALDVTKGVGMVMNRSAYKELFSTDLAKNNDFVQLSGAGGEVAVRFYGCDVITLPDISLPEKAIFFVPSLSYGFAAWEEGVISSSEFHNGDDSLWLTAKSSMGAVVLDEEAIIKYEY
jgi:hypothetical protein